MYTQKEENETQRGGRVKKEKKAWLNEFLISFCGCQEG
jgi:hypothetical protein